MLFTTLIAKIFAEKFGKNFSCKNPIFLIYAISDFGSLNLALNKTRFSQFFQVLGDGRLGNRKLIMNVAKET